MNNSDYCYIHSFKHLKKVPFYKNGTIHSIILALLIFTAQQYLSHKSKISLIQEMRHLDNTSFAKLIRKYPAGYVLFAVDHSRVVTPNENRIMNDYKINWQSVKVTEIHDTLISMNLPDIEFQRSRTTANVVSFIRRDDKQRIFPFPYGIFPHEIYIELIYDEPGGFIFVLGFRNRT